MMGQRLFIKKKLDTCCKFRKVLLRELNRELKRSKQSSSKKFTQKFFVQLILSFGDKIFIHNDYLENRGRGKCQIAEMSMLAYENLHII